MKRVITTIAVVLMAVHAGYADLPGPIEDYLPHMGEGVIGSGEDLFSFSSIDEFEVEDNKWKLKADMAHTNEQGILTLEELEFNPDPLVTGSLLIENTTAFTQTYHYHFSQPAFLPTASSTVRGAVVVTLLDKSDIPFDGSLFTDNGTPVYKAYIDGNEVETLMDPTYSLTTVPLETTNDDSEEFDWQPYGAGVASSIDIQIEFTLSAGDSATVQSRFEVIPEPASMVLIGVASSLILFVRRKFIV